MRRLVLLALVVPVLSACGWPLFHSTGHAAARTIYPCGDSPPAPFPCPVNLGPTGRPWQGTVMWGGGELTDNARDSYLRWASSTVTHRESTVQIPLPPGSSTISDLQVRITTEPGGHASWGFTVDKNGAATALYCAISSLASGCGDESIVAVSADDTIDLHVTPIGWPALTTLTWSFKLLP